MGNGKRFSPVCRRLRSLCRFFYGVGMLQRSLFFLAGDCFLYALPFAVWAGEKVLVFLLALLMTAVELFEQKTEKN